MANLGWIKLRRSLIEWEWYDDHNATRLLIHLNIVVNYEDKKWKGQIIKAGSMVYSWDTLSAAVGLSIQQTRTSMSKLESSQEVTRKVTNKYQVLTLVKWVKFQVNEKKVTGKVTDKQQTTNRQVTTTKEVKEIKEQQQQVIEIDDVELINNIYNKFIGEIKDKRHGIWADNTYRRLHLKPHSLTKLLDNFKSQLLVSNTVHKNVNEMRNHLNNWLNNQDSLGKLKEYKIKT
jgi:hypothetical protein